MEDVSGAECSTGSVFFVLADDLAIYSRVHRLTGQPSMHLRCQISILYVQYFKKIITMCLFGPRPHLPALSLQPAHTLLSPLKQHK